MNDPIPTDLAPDAQQRVQALIAARSILGTRSPLAAVNHLAVLEVAEWILDGTRLPDDDTCTEPGCEFHVMLPTRMTEGDGFTLAPTEARDE